MALKNLSILDSNVMSYSNEAQVDSHRGRLNAPISDGVLFREPCPPFLDEGSPRTVPSLQDDDDYELALVSRRDRGGRTRPILQPSATLDRVLLLQFTWQELIDRLRRELNHSNSVSQSMIARFGEVRVNLLTMETSRSEKPVTLTAQEFKLLRFFLQTPERVFSRHELLNKAWGYDNYPSTRTVDTHICMLRQKLEPAPAHPIHFLTVHGMGYKFVP
jgi:DNA-binding winged helix-turn-helix (wHTH) protein